MTRAVTSTPQRRLRRRDLWLSRGEEGSAVVEFVTLGVLLLVPVVYLVLVLGRIQAGVFAVEGAAREAARVVAGAPDEQVAAARASAAVRFALLDQGFDVPAASALQLECSAVPCLTPGGQVRATVRVDVTLPGVPAVLDLAVPARVPVQAHAVQVVDRFGP